MNLLGFSLRDSFRLTLSISLYKSLLFTELLQTKKNTQTMNSSSEKNKRKRRCPEVSGDPKSKKPNGKSVDSSAEPLCSMIKKGRGRVNLRSSHVHLRLQRAGNSCSHLRYCLLKKVQSFISSFSFLLCMTAKDFSLCVLTDSSTDYFITTMLSILCSLFLFV
ncbi:hypothetical protein HA466_0208070 [Hirschfeldia incana]|nr:hypothetical protein HA466_0208070 [Hirschfeldia incana]